VLGTAGTRGVLEGLSRFGLVNAIKIPTNVAIIIAPVFVLPFSDNLYPITAVLVASRALAFLSYFYLCFHFLPGLKKLLRPNATHIKKLLNFGSWLTVTSIVGSLMALGYVDRFLIGSMLTINSVTYYVTPFEIVTKLWAIPISMVGVMFPVFSAYTISHKEKLHALHQVAIKYILLILTPIVIAIIVLAKPFLRIWLGPAFPPQSALVLQILAVGVLMNAVGHVPYIAIQSLGRPDLTAKRHLWELPFYLIIMWYFIKTMGIIGAAATWLLWTVIDAVLLFQMVKAVMPRTQVSQKFHKWRLIAVIGTLFLLAYLSSIFPNIYLKIGLLTIILLTAIGLGWTLMIDNLEKTYIKDFIVRLWQKMI
jgi:O-antigen/teichoic acid export membrane protein